MSKDLETRLKEWGATERGGRFLAAVYGTVIGIALISMAAEFLSR